MWSVCLSIYLSSYPSDFLYYVPSVCSLFVCLFVCLYVCMSVRFFVCLSMYQNMCVYLSLCLYACQSVYPSVRLSICPFFKIHYPSRSSHSLQQLVSFISADVNPFRAFMVDRPRPLPSLLLFLPLLLGSQMTPRRVYGDRGLLIQVGFMCYTMRRKRRRERGKER